MKTMVAGIVIGSLLLSGVVAAEEMTTLSGENSGRPAAFSVEGPWTLDWSARSDSVDLASFELRLYDAKTGDFIGMVAEVKGTGNGLKLFENGGTFQLVVVGTLVEWDIEIQQISAELAATLMRTTQAKPSLADSATKASRLVPEGSFESWRPQGNQQLLLFDDNRIAWRVSFTPPCPGLESATAISFVMTADGGQVGQYDSILLDDGTRCYFEKVMANLLP